MNRNSATAWYCGFWLALVWTGIFYPGHGEFGLCDFVLLKKPVVGISVDRGEVVQIKAQWRAVRRYAESSIYVFHGQRTMRMHTPEEQRVPFPQYMPLV
jgi:hypothetical protein